MGVVVGRRELEGRREEGTPTLLAERIVTSEVMLVCDWLLRSLGHMQQYCAEMSSTRNLSDNEFVFSLYSHINTEFCHTDCTYGI